MVSRKLVVFCSFIIFCEGITDKTNNIGGYVQREEFLGDHHPNENIRQQRQNELQNIKFFPSEEDTLRNALDRIQSQNDPANVQFFPSQDNLQSNKNEGRIDLIRHERTVNFFPENSNTGASNNLVKNINQNRYHNDGVYNNPQYSQIVFDSNYQNGNAPNYNAENLNQENYQRRPIYQKHYIKPFQNNGLYPDNRIPDDEQYKYSQGNSFAPSYFDYYNHLKQGNGQQNGNSGYENPVVNNPDQNKYKYSQENGYVGPGFNENYNQQNTDEHNHGKYGYDNNRPDDNKYKYSQEPSGYAENYGKYRYDNTYNKIHGYAQNPGYYSHSSRPNRNRYGKSHRFDHSGRYGSAYDSNYYAQYYGEKENPKQNSIVSWGHKILNWVLGNDADQLYPYGQDNGGRNTLSLPPMKDALDSLSKYDDLQCVPRLLCDIASEMFPKRKSTGNKNSFMPEFMNLESLTNILSVVPTQSPLLKFGRAALIGVANPRNCNRTYTSCPNDPDKLIYYLNNHRGGFFRFFNGGDQFQSATDGTGASGFLASLGINIPGIGNLATPDVSNVNNDVVNNPSSGNTNAALLALINLASNANKGDSADNLANLAALFNAAGVGGTGIKRMDQGIGNIFNAENTNSKFIGFENYSPGASRFRELVNQLPVSNRMKRYSSSNSDRNVISPGGNKTFPQERVLNLKDDKSASSFQNPYRLNSVGPSGTWTFPTDEEKYFAYQNHDVDNNLYTTNLFQGEHALKVKFPEESSRKPKSSHYFVENINDNIESSFQNTRNPKYVSFPREITAGNLKYEDSFEDIPKPLPFYDKNRTIFPDRTGTGNLRFDTDEILSSESNNVAVFTHTNGHNYGTFNDFVNNKINNNGRFGKRIIKFPADRLRGFYNEQKN